MIMQKGYDAVLIPGLRIPCSVMYLPPTFDSFIGRLDSTSPGPMILSTGPHSPAF